MPSDVAAQNSKSKAERLEAQDVNAYSDNVKLKAQAETTPSASSR